MKKKESIPERLERQRRTQRFLKAHSPVLEKMAAEKYQRMLADRAQLYEWHCLKDESHQWTEEHPQTKGFFVVELKLEFLLDDGTKTTNLSRCCWNGQYFMYMPTLCRRAYRIFWRKAREPFLKETENETNPT